MLMEGANIQNNGFALKHIALQEENHKTEKNQILYNVQCGITYTNLARFAVRVLRTTSVTVDPGKQSNNLIYTDHNMKS